MEDIDAGQAAAPELYAIGGGKGGVGKTCFAVNMAVEIARNGWRVVLVDADLGCSNVEAMLGTEHSRRLDDFLFDTGEDGLDAVIAATSYPNLSLVPGTTGLVDAANPRLRQKDRLIEALPRVDADVIIIDLEAGAHLNTLDLFLMTGPNGVLVITPEKTSVDNAFKFLRAALFRKIERFYQSPEVGMLLKRNETLGDFTRSIQASTLFGAGAKKRICGEIVALARSLRPKVVVNRARNAYEAQIAANILSRLARQDLYIKPEPLGFLFFDKHVSEAVNSGVPFIVSHPQLKVSACVTDIANRLGFMQP